MIEAVDGKGAHDIHAELVARIWRELAPVGIFEEEYAWQLVDVIWRRRRLMSWEAATIQNKVSVRETSHTKREQQTPSAALLALLDSPTGSSSLEPQESVTTGPADGGSPSRQDQEFERPLAGLLGDPDLTILLRYDTYLSNKFGKICRELQRLQAARNGGLSRATDDPVCGPPVATASTEESPTPIEPGVAGAYSDSNDAAVPPESGSRRAISSPGRSSMKLSEYFKGTGGPSADRKNGK